MGVATLTFLLADPMNRLALAQNGLLWVAGAMPYLQVGWAGGVGGGVECEGRRMASGAWRRAPFCLPPRLHCAAHAFSIPPAAP